MSGGKLSVKQAFGLNKLIKNCFTFSEEHHLVYPSGNQLVVLNTETKDQSFISGTSTYQHQSHGITAVTCSLSKKIIAVAEKVDPTGIITFYDAHSLRKKRVLANNELGSNEIKCMSFSEDGKYFLVQGCGPEWNLVLWHIEKSVKIICTMKISLSDDSPVHQVSFCPWDSNIILVIGKSILRLFRFIEGQLRPVTLTIRRDQSNFISHCWVPDDNLLLGNEGGEILLIESLEYRGIVYPTTPVELEDVQPILSLVTTPRGFIAGSIDGCVKVFERQEDTKEKYNCEIKLYISLDPGSISSMVLGTDEMLILGTEKHQLLSISLTNLNSLKESSFNVLKNPSSKGTPTFSNYIQPVSKKGDNQSSHNASSSMISKQVRVNNVQSVSSPFDYLVMPFHGPNSRGECGIVAMDTAAWKQIVVTIGKDRTVRVWNYLEKRMELARQFEDEPLSLSVHPSGIYFAVAFSDSIKILSYLLDDIHITREISTRSCSYVKFSRGGQYLAAANGTNLQVYDTYTGAPVCTLRGHNNKIKSVMWLNFDSRIISIGTEGVVYMWDLFLLSRRNENFPGSTPISGGSGPADGSKVYISTSDRLLKEISFLPVIDNGVAKEVSSVKPTKELDMGLMISCMLYDDLRKMLLLGTYNEEVPGAVISCLTVPNLNSTFDISSIHSSSITALAQSYDGSLIFSADSNGCLCISEFENPVFNSITRSSMKVREGMMAFEFNEEVMIHRSSLDARKNEIKQLTMKVEELNQNNDHQLRLKEIEHRERLREITEKYTLQLNTEKIKYDELEEEKFSIEKEFNRKVNALEQKQMEELKAMELKYKTKQNAEINRHKLLVEELQAAHASWNEENLTLLQSHQNYLHELTLDYEERVATEQRAQRDVTQQKDFLQVKFESVKDDTEIDGDREISEMKMRYGSKLKQEEEMGIELMAQHALMKKNLQILTKDSNQQKEEIRRLKEKEARLLETISSLDKDIQSHKKEIRDREETITDKEKRIFDLKKKNQELEKFRFVLDYKIKELKLQIAPREKEITTMQKQTEEMNLELDQYSKSNLALNLMIQELKLKLDGVRLELEKQNHRHEINGILMDKYKRDLKDLWDVREDPNGFKNIMVKIYRIYVQEDLSPETLALTGQATAGNKAKKTDMDDPQQVYNRDREQLERSLDSLRRSLKGETIAHRRDTGKMMRENVLLTKELNHLRRNFRMFKIQTSLVEQVNQFNPTTHNAGELQDIMELLGIDINKKTAGRGTGGGGGGGGMSQNKTLKSKSDGNIQNNLQENSFQSGDGSSNSNIDERSGVGRLGKLSSEPPVPPSPPSIRKQHPARSQSARLVNGKDKSASLLGRSAALVTTHADGRVEYSGLGVGLNASRQDQWEAWREIQMQYDQMKVLEDQLVALCDTLNIDANQVIYGIDSNLATLD